MYSSSNDTAKGIDAVFKEFSKAFTDEKVSTRKGGKSFELRNFNQEREFLMTASFSDERRPDCDVRHRDPLWADGKSLHSRGNHLQGDL